MGHRTRSFVLLAAMLAVLGLAAGCGDSEDESTSAGGGATSSENTGGAEDAQAKVEEYQQTSGVEFPQPDEAFDAGTGQVTVISCGNAGINCLKGSEDVQAAARAMGWEPSAIRDGEFTPAKQAGFVQRAIQQNADAIVLVSIDAASIQAAIDAAAEAEIPVACVMCANEGAEGMFVDVSSGGVTEGEAIGTWIASTADEGAKILAYDDKSFPIVAVRRENMKEALEQYCPSCEVEDGDYPTSDLQEAGQPTFTAALSANPAGSLDYVAAPYDPAAIPMAKAAEQRDRDDFQMTGYDASPEYVQMIQSGEGVAAATTAAPFPYASWGAMDQVARMKAGLEPWESNRLPVALVTEDNASEFADTDGFFDPPDFDYKAMFTEQWGVEGGS